MASRRCYLRPYLALTTALTLIATGTLATPAHAALLEFVEAQQRDVRGVTGLAGVLAVVVSADGRNVYAAGGNDDAVVVFDRDPRSGALTFIQVVKDGIDGVDGLGLASALALSPDGAHVYVTGARDDTVAVFARDQATGTLTFVEAQKEGNAGADGIKHASAVVVSPDGSFVYVAGQLDDAIAVFRRNALTGWLNFVAVLREGVDGVHGIAGPLGLALSADGTTLYVASGDEYAVAVLKRDTASGKLRLADVEEEGARDFGLGGIHSVVASGDGANLYAVAQGDSAVVTFRRNKRTGALTLADVVADGVDDVEGLHGALRAAVSPDGTKLYVASTHDNAVAAFERNPTSGALSFIEMQKGNPECLAYARAVAVSPDGKNVYVAGASSNAVAVFRVTE